VVVFARKPSVVMPVFDEQATFFANCLYNRWMSDIMTGQKAMLAELFARSNLRARGFAIGPEITARPLRRGRIHEVPIDYRARTREEEKLTVVDGLRVVVTLLRCRFT
jgi:hypothetical protein